MIWREKYPQNSGKKVSGDDLEGKVSPEQREEGIWGRSRGKSIPRTTGRRDLGMIWREKYPQNDGKKGSGDDLEGKVSPERQDERIWGRSGEKSVPRTAGRTDLGTVYR